MPKDLIYVPMLHAPTEQGSIGLHEALREDPAFLPVGYEEGIEGYWKVIFADLQVLLSASHTPVKIFAEGFCGDMPEAIMHRFRQTPSEEFKEQKQWLQWVVAFLLEHGAELCVTENRFLIERAKAYSKLIGRYRKHISQLPPDRLEDLIKRLTFKVGDERDKVIAQSLVTQVLEGERAILFLGTLHDVRPLLGSEWNITLLQRHELLPDTLKKLLRSNERLFQRRPLIYPAS